MVSSQFSTLNGNCSQKPFLNNLLLPSGPRDLLPDYVDFEFSDVFGPAPVEASIAVGSEKPGNLVAAQDSSENIYNDPSVIRVRSHSLLAPTTSIIQSLELSKLTLHEAGDALDLVEEVHRETQKELMEDSVKNTAVEKNNLQVNDHCLNHQNQTIGVEDFEVLKVVGQGAFGKVYQVRRTGTSEIYAMKVMRKDKIMQRNHAEYVKSERDILTKVEHAFIVRLRYSFQVIFFPEQSYL